MIAQPLGTKEWLAGRNDLKLPRELSKSLIREKRLVENRAGSFILKWRMKTETGEGRRREEERRQA